MNRYEVEVSLTLTIKVGQLAGTKEEARVDAAAEAINTLDFKGLDFDWIAASVEANHTVQTPNTD